MIISGFLSESFQDWNGLTSVIFTGGCTYNCPACYAKKLTEMTEKYDYYMILNRLERKKQYINKIVICGGEPTLNEDLPDFLKVLRKKGFLTKLDTNGTNPHMLKEILENKLIDHLAMDIKAPESLYPQVTGVKEVDFENLEESMALATKFPDHEFRTTLAPLYTNENGFRWMSCEEIERLAKWIVDKTGTDKHRYYLQRFTARDESEMIDKKFSKQKLPKEYHETPKAILEELLVAAKKYLPLTQTR